LLDEARKLQKQIEEKMRPLNDYREIRYKTLAALGVFIARKDFIKDNKKLGHKFNKAIEVYTGSWRAFRQGFETDLPTSNQSIIAMYNKSERRASELVKEYSELAEHLFKSKKNLGLVIGAEYVFRDLVGKAAIALGIQQIDTETVPAGPNEMDELD